MFDSRYSKVGTQETLLEQEEGKAKATNALTAALYSFVSARVNRTRKNYTFLSLR